MKRSLNTAAVTVGTMGLLALGFPSASAHVTISPEATQAGAYSVLTVSVPHGCGDEPTTRIAIQMPDEFDTVTPTVHPTWDVDAVVEQLDEPVDDGHGGMQTERISEVVYEAHTPLPADQRDAFELSVQLPDTPGEEIVFPVVQTCGDEESAWIQQASAGQDSGDLEWPAPTVSVTDDRATDEAVETVAAEEDYGPRAAVSWTALGLGAAGLVLGAFAVARPRKA